MTENAPFVTDTRVYHNVFYETAFTGVSLPAPTTNVFSGHLFKNNVLASSAYDGFSSQTLPKILDGDPVQILMSRLDGYRFEQNDIFGTAPGQTNVIAFLDPAFFTSPSTLDWWQQNHPELFAHNLEMAPQFVAPEKADFMPAPQSPLIDAGTFLTRTVSTGSGTMLPVEDASYFYDGFAIPGEVGDEIQFEGGTVAARLLHVDYANNILVLDRPLNWLKGQGVALRYVGIAPDLGAFESPPPSPHLTIQRRTGAVEVSWDRMWQDYVLETAPITAPSAWQGIANPWLRGESWVVTQPSVGSQLYRLVKRPQLTLRNQDQSLILSWPGYATGYRVESASSLNGPWQLEPAAELTNGVWTIVRPAGQGILFYRLVWQVNRPRLDIRSEGQSLIVSWPGYITGYGLESSSSLNAAWQLEPATELRNGVWTATRTAGQGARFYRLVALESPCCFGKHAGAVKTSRRALSAASGRRAALSRSHAGCLSRYRGETAPARNSRGATGSDAPALLWRGVGGR